MHCEEEDGNGQRAQEPLLVGLRGCNLRARARLESGQHRERHERGQDVVRVVRGQVEEPRGPAGEQRLHRQVRQAADAPEHRHEHGALSYTQTQSSVMVSLYCIYLYDNTLLLVYHINYLVATV